MKNGIRVGDVASFKVNLTNAVPEDLIVFIIAPDGTPESFGLRMISEDVCEYSYYPTKVGEHRISVKLSNAEVPLSPFLVRVGALMESNVRVYGPGLSGGAVGYAANFHVDMNGEPGMLGKRRISRFCNRSCFAIIGRQSTPELILSQNSATPLQIVP